MSKRPNYREMDLAQLEAIDHDDRIRTGRADAFDHGKPETILKYWDEYGEPNPSELRTIVRNILERLQCLTT